MPGPTTHARALFTLLLVLPARAFADDADDASRRASDLAARGDLAGAIAALTPVRDAYPQDYGLALEVAALESRRGGGARAIAAYRVAVARSPQAIIARQGLVDALARGGACDEAERELTGFVEPGADLAARAAVRQCRSRAPSAGVSLGAAYGHLAFPGHAYKRAADGVAVGAGLLHGGLELSATGRYYAVGSRDEATVPAFSAEEGFLSAGYGTRRLGASVQVATMHDGSGTLGTSFHAGTALRWSPAGDLVLALAFSHYDDLDVARIAPSYRLDLGAGFSLTPSAALQRAQGATYGSGSLGLAFDRASFGLFAGAKLGEEVRPAYLSSAVVYAIPEHVARGAWGGARVAVSDHVALRATYAFDQLVSSGSSSGSQIHSFTIGPVLTF